VGFKKEKVCKECNRVIGTVGYITTIIDMEVYQGLKESERGAFKLDYGSELSLGSRVAVMDIDGTLMVRDCFSHEKTYLFTGVRKYPDGENVVGYGIIIHIENRFSESTTYTVLPIDFEKIT